METRKDINSRTPVIGNVIVFPQCSYGGKRKLTKAPIVNIGAKGNPVVELPVRRWSRETGIYEDTIKRPIVTDFMIC